MEDTNRMSLCFLLILGSVLYASGDLIFLPPNMAALEGSTVTINCAASSIPEPRIMWTEYASTDIERIISDNKGIVPAHPNAARYSITGGPMEFNLEIRNLSMADGGRYVCQDINGVPPATYRGVMELIVLNNDPVCTDINTITGVVVEDNFYWNECDLKYRGNYPPQMRWTGPGAFNTDNSLTNNEVWSRITFIAHRDIETQQFICTTSFSVIEDLPPDFATNTPTYQHVFRGSVLIVNWGPKNLTIDPRLPMYQVGDVLTCTADAKPPPRFVWTNIRTQVPEPAGPSFTVQSDLLGTEQLMRCNAESVIEGILFTQDAFVNLTVSGITTPTTPGTTTTPTIPPPDSPCLDLTGQWTSINPNALLCIEMDSKGNLLALLRNGTDSFFVTGNGKTVYNDYKHIGLAALWPAGSDFGVGGFSGECHRCLGNEIILMAGLARNKHSSNTCGASAGTRLTNHYAFTRFGPPCRNPPGKVFRPSEAHIKAMGILPENIIS